MYSILSKEEYKVSLLYTEHRGHEQELAKRAVLAGANIIAVCGGTGSAFFALQSIIGHNVQLALVPTGAGNIFPYLFDIRSVRQGIENIKTGELRSVDVGRIENEELGSYYFLGFVGVGFSGVSAHRALQKKKRFYLDYMRGIYRLFKTHKSYSIQMKLNDEVKFAEPFELFIGNIQSYGRSFSFIPFTSVFDGFLDILMIPSVKLWRFWLFIVISTIGFQDKVKEYSDYYRAKKISIDLKDEQFIQVDYEPFFVKGKIDISVQSLMVDIFLPRNAINI